MVRKDRVARYWPLIGVLLVYAVFATAGINWGLPSRDVDPYLFGGDEPWPGGKIHELAGAARKVSDTRGADVDADPLDKDRWPVPLADTEERAAAIYLRYRLYTHQPDEMITLMALSRMRPGDGDLDPGLYQYGGLFVYPVGALIKLCGLVGLIEVRSDLVYYLDNPDEFGKFYVVARAYVAAWGLVGIVLVYLIARRLQDRWAGLAAALLCGLLPVVVCMSHEAKPHLPGAVLMLLAVLLAGRYVEAGRRRDWWLLCIACGAALGMVLSSLPVLVLIPFVEWLRVQRNRCGLKPAVGRAAAGVGLGVLVYLVTNPYVPINLLANRAVLQSNFSNSLAMYEIDRPDQGLVRMVELTVEGATWPVLIVGAVGVGLLVRRRQVAGLPLAVVGGLIFVQFVLIGAGKPAEYGRFGIFINIALAIAAACVLTQRWPHLGTAGRVIPTLLVASWVGVFGYRYLSNFVADAGPDNSRLRAAAALAGHDAPLALLAEPAPYCCPPVDFARRQLWLFESADAWGQRCEADGQAGRCPEAGLLIATADGPTPPSGQLPVPYRWELLTNSSPAPGEPPVLTPISWANKPIRRQVASSTPVAGQGHSR